MKNRDKPRSSIGFKALCQREESHGSTNVQRHFHPSTCSERVRCNSRPRIGEGIFCHYVVVNADDGIESDKHLIALPPHGEGYKWHCCHINGLKEFDQQRLVGRARESIEHAPMMDLSDDMASQVNAQFNRDAREALLKALVE